MGPLWANHVPDDNKCYLRNKLVQELYNSTSGTIYRLISLQYLFDLNKIKLWDVCHEVDKAVEKCKRTDFTCGHGQYSCQEWVCDYYISCTERPDCCYL